MNFRMSAGWDADQTTGRQDDNGPKRFPVWSIVVGLGLGVLACLVLIYHVAPASNLPSRLLRDAEQAFAKADFSPTAMTISSARIAAAQAPLEAAPFYYAALELDEKGQADKIIALLDEALKRDPRHSYARLLRARVYYLTGRVSEAVDEVSTVASLDHTKTEDCVNALVDLAADPRSHSSLLRHIKDKPVWSAAFLQRANASLKDEDFLLALVASSPTAFDNYVQRLMDTGQFERAFLIWQSQLTRSQLLGFSWPYDSSFDSEKEGSAFGWRISSSIATRENDGLYVFFNSRGEKTAATQSIMLGPGHAYTLTASMSGELDPDSASFEWTIRCVESGKIAADLTISALGARPEHFSSDFSIPTEGCAVQSIALIAHSGARASPARITVHELRISERGSVRDPTAAKAIHQPISYSEVSP